MIHPFLTDRLPLLPITRLAMRNIKMIINPGTLKVLNQGRNVTWRRKKQTEAQKRGHKLPDYFIQSYFGQPSTAIIENFVSEIQEGEVGEFMFHLGQGDYKLEYKRKRHRGIREASLKRRADELKVLLQSNLGKLLAPNSELGLTKVKYQDLRPK